MADSIEDIREQFLISRRRYIKNQFTNLNEQQLVATLQVGGPMLILAGAGSGKTTVLVNRIRNLIEFGTAYETQELHMNISKRDLELLNSSVSNGLKAPESIKHLLFDSMVQPWNILAITFTNKAANELKTRITEMVGERGKQVFASTFHSACVRFLRRDANRIGYKNDFSIYDSDDSRRMIRTIIKEIGVNENIVTVGGVASQVSKAKDMMISPLQYTNGVKNYYEELIARIYTEYQQRLKAANAMDFDDLIYLMVEVLEKFEDVKEYYRERFMYIFVDEYQDTSFAQFRLIKLLTNKDQNICVVGDDDQSIYKFRGATIENILTFEESFIGAKIVRLEQNYRSTGNILEAANKVILNNHSRKGKTLWTANEHGAEVSVFSADSEEEETSFIVSKIEQAYKEGQPYKSNAILYRMNAQSKQYENELYFRGIPYRIYGAIRFLDRAEIKDMLAYLSIVNNSADDLRLKRIINNPTRKIGKTTIDTVEAIASSFNMSMLDVIKDASDYPMLERASKALGEFYKIYLNLCQAYEDSSSLIEFSKSVFKLSGYEAMLEKDLEGGRIENIDMMFSTIERFEQEFGESSLDDFLSYLSLYSDTDTYDANEDVVVLMTLHSAKGLEFDNVFMPAMEEGIFPIEKSWYNPEDIEEERRLCYVGITRARKNLYVSYASTRMLFGKTMRNKKSRFLNELPKEGISNISDEVTNLLVTKEIIPKNLLQEYMKPIQSELKKKSNVSAVKHTDYNEGDIVEHKVFGRGIILSIRKLSSDSILEVAFEEKGTKKIMAAMASMKRL